MGTYDKLIADKVLKDLRNGLKTGKFTDWNKGKEMENNENNTNETVAAEPVKAKGPKGRPAAVSQEVFQKLWEEADSLSVVVDKLSRFKAFEGRDPQKIKLYASMRATNLRTSGIQLKEFKRGRRKKAVTANVVSE